MKESRRPIFPDLTREEVDRILKAEEDLRRFSKKRFGAPQSSYRVRLDTNRLNKPVTRGREI